MHWCMILVFSLPVLIYGQDICDSTCFGLPAGALGCGIRDTLFPPTTRQRFTCPQWVDLTVNIGPITLNLGQVCPVLALAGDVVAVRTEDQSQLENIAITRGDGGAVEGRQNGVPRVTFEDSKAVCEVDLGGSLFNFNDLLPNPECAENYLNLLDIFEATSVSQVMNDRGPTQDQLAILLSGTSSSYFLNATIDPTFRYLYEYAVEVDSPLNIHHYVNPPPAGTTPPECLSITSENGQLKSLGVDCGDLLTPLCFRNSSDITAVVEENCSKTTCNKEKFECQNWLDLEPFEFTAGADGLNYYISDAELCINPCNINGGKTSWENAQSACEDIGGSLLSFNNFVDTETEAANFLSAEDFSTSVLVVPTSGPIQNLLNQTLLFNDVHDIFFVDSNMSEILGETEQLAYLYGNDETESFFLYQLVDDSTSVSSQTTSTCLTISQRLENPTLIFQGVDCQAEIKPLCLKGNAVVQPKTSPARLRWKQRQKQKQRNYKKKGKKSKLKEVKAEGRQDATAVDYCLAALPILPIIALLNPVPSGAVPQPQPIQPPPPPPPPPIQRLNDIQDFETFKDRYNKVYFSAAEEAFRRQIFLDNLAVIEAQNMLFLAGQSSYFSRVNRFSDMTFDEFRRQNLGLGLFPANNSGAILPQALTRGFLDRNLDAPDSFDLSTSGCITSVKNQACNSCAAHSTAATVEFCLCKASGQLPRSRSVQQLSECTDGRKLDIGSMIERGNTFCVSGFPDVHLDFVLKELNGNIDAAINYEESNVNGGCNRLSREFTSARVSDYVSDIFTNEKHLIDALTLIGQTATNIAVTPQIQHYGGGVYYNPTECVDYEFEDVPPQCVEERNGRMSYTCLDKNGVKCSELLPDHCNIFFVPSNTSYPHSLTVIGYGQDRDGLFWRMKNSWGTDWGEDGFLRIAKDLGHCGVGSMFTVPQC